MKLRLYLDTSVFSARIDDRAPDRKTLTEDFWETLPDYDRSTSELAVEELQQTADPQLRSKMEAMLAGFSIIPVTDEMRRLAGQYIFGRGLLSHHAQRCGSCRGGDALSTGHPRLVEFQASGQPAEACYGSQRQRPRGAAGAGHPLATRTVETAMRYFDYQTVARGAGITPAQLDLLVAQLSAESRQDPMLAELHLLRACMAIQAGALTIEQALADTEPAALAA